MTRKSRSRPSEVFVKMSAFDGSVDLGSGVTVDGLAGQPWGEGASRESSWRTSDEQEESRTALGRDIAEIESARSRARASSRQRPGIRSRDDRS